MLLAMDPDATIPYILQEDRDSLDPTTFYIKPLDVKTASKIKDRLVVFETSPEGDVKLSNNMRFNAFELFLDVVRMGLVNWDLKYKAGNGEIIPAPFRRSEAHHTIYGLRAYVEEASMNYLKPLWVQELATAIVGESFLTAPKEKNSVGP